MGEMLRDISLVWILFHCIIMFLMLFESRLNAKKTNIISLIAFTALAVINMSALYLFGAEMAALMLPVTCVLPSLILFYIMSGNRGSHFLFTFCFTDTIVLWVMVFTKLLDIASGVEGYIVMFVTRIVFILLIEFLIYKFVRKTYQDLQNKITKGWGVFTITGMLFYVALLCYALKPSMITPDFTVSFPLFFMLAILPVMYITIYILIKSQIETADVKEKNSILNMQIQMAQERISSNMHQEEEAKILRHDIKHHMVLLYDYIDNGEAEKAKDYINSFNETLDAHTNKSFCSNSAINAVLCYYEKIAADRGFVYEADVKLPNELTVDEQDLVVLLSNAVENSINHLTQTKAEGEKARIAISIFSDGAALLIEVKNPCAHSVQFENGVPVANKKRHNHGIGTKSMIHLVKKYEGIYSFTIENGEFIFRCGI